MDEGKLRLVKGNRIDSSKILLTKAADIQHYITDNVLKGYCRRNGYKDIKSIPDEIILRARNHWMGMRAANLLANVGTEDDWSQDPISFLHLAMAMQEEAERRY